MENSWTWNGKVLYLEDPPDSTLKHQALKVLASGGNKISTVVDGKIQHIKVQGKPVILITSYQSNIDVEGMRRWDAVRLDTSEKLTKLCLDEILSDDEKQIESDLELRLGLKYRLERLDVVIPFKKYIGEKISNKLVMRTQIHKLLDFIRASAILHQYQRLKTDDGKLIATLDDYAIGSYIFNILKCENATALNVTQEKLIETIKDQGDLTLPEICMMFSERNKTWIYENVKTLTDLGLIKMSGNEYSESAHRNVSTYRVVDNYNSIGIPKCSEVFHSINERLPTGKNTSKWVGVPQFHKIAKEIDNERERSGLSKVFNGLSEDWKTPSKKQDSLDVSTVPDEKRNKLEKTGKTYSLKEKLEKLKIYVQKQEGKKGSVTIEALRFSFDNSIVNHAIENGLLIPMPGKSGYVWKGGS